MPLLDLIKETIKMFEMNETMPLHFTLKKSVRLHGSIINHGRYDYISHDMLDNKFVYRNRLRKTISLSLKDYKSLVKAKLIES